MPKPRSIFDVAVETERLRGVLRAANIEARLVVEPNGTVSLYGPFEVFIALAERVQEAAVLDRVIAAVRERADDDGKVSSANVVDIVRRALVVAPMIASTERAVELTEADGLVPARTVLALDAADAAVASRQIELDLPPDDAALPPTGSGPFPTPALKPRSTERYAVGGTKLGPLVVVEGAVVSSGRR